MLAACALAPHISHVASTGVGDSSKNAMLASSAMLPECWDLSARHSQHTVARGAFSESCTLKLSDNNVPTWPAYPTPRSPK